MSTNERAEVEVDKSKVDKSKVDKSKVDKVEGAKPVELSPDVIEADIVQTRDRLAASVDELADAANPATLAKNTAESVKNWFVDPDGSVRTSRVAKVAAGVAGALLLRGIVRRGS